MVVTGCDQRGPYSKVRLGLAVLFVTAFAFAVSVPGAAAAARGELDCNGMSTIQSPLRGSMNCTDIRGFSNEWNNNTWGGRFYDNGRYIGHDEPDVTFLSSNHGSGNDVSWTETLPRDPSAAPTVSTPGSDVTHWFELSPAPWFSMAMCDPNSYPQAPCTPESDSNAPAANGTGGGGSAFMEMQLYPPGEPPWVDSSGCDNTHWCSALTIDSLECTEGFAYCNPKCEEPVNFAFIQTNGVPAGPPSPQDVTLASGVPNADTLMMNPGDQIQVHMFDAAVPGGGGEKAFEVVLKDLTTGQSGFMQASAANGFQTTSMTSPDCSGKPFNFQPEYNTAAKANIIPWAALQTNISTEFETGHFEPCTAVHDQLTPNPLDPYDTGGTYNSCSGPYETAGGPEGIETGGAVCYQAGDTHPGYDGPGTSTPPDEVTGCQDNWFQNGDLDFDGTPYYADWPVGTAPTPTVPSSFVQELPHSGGASYGEFFMQTDVALSESVCNGATGADCRVPPRGPGNFYPYWTRVTGQHGCALEFGNVSSGSGTNDYGQDAQYGSVQSATLGYPEFEGPVMRNTCSPAG